MEMPLRVSHKPVRNVSEVVRELRVEPRRVAKSIVFEVGREQPGHVLAVVPGDAKVSLVRLAARVGARVADTRLAPDAESVTGLPIGAISPLRLVGRVRTIVDVRLAGLDQVWVGCGSLTASLVLSGPLLVLLSRAEVADIADLR